MYSTRPRKNQKLYFAAIAVPENFSMLADHIIFEFGITAKGNCLSVHSIFRLFPAGMGNI